MILSEATGIIELGNANIKCLIFKIDNNDNLQILSTYLTESQGIHNGVIINLAKASSVIRTCISAAEKKAGVAIKKINVIVEQPEFLCTKLSKHKKIDGSKIKKYDIEFLLKEAKKQVTLNDDKQSIIHIFNYNYIVDKKKFIEEPIDVYADSLSHEMTFVSMPKNNLKNIKQAFIDCDVEVERFISSIFACAAKSLNNNQLQLGSVLIDIGFEKISLGLFKNLALVHSITFPVGINHIMKDISKVCSLSLEESEIIRNKIDYSFKNNEELFDNNEYLKNLYFSNSNFRKISKSLIVNIIKARLDEILELLKNQIIVTGLNSTAGINFFILGDGSNLINLEKYCSDFFGSSVNKLEKYYEEENKDDFEKDFISCLGAVRIINDGWETEAIPEPIYDEQKTNFFAKIFGKKS